MTTMGDRDSSGSGVHDVATIDVSELTPEKRDALSMTLRADRIHHEFAGDTLRVPAVWTSRAQLHVDHVRRALVVAPTTHRPYAKVRQWLVGNPVPRPWRRWTAAIVDNLVVGIPVGLLGAARVRGVDVAGVVVMTVYILALTAWRGQTIGKMLLGIKVVDADHGTVPSLPRCLRRVLPFEFPVVVGLILSPHGEAALLLSILWMLWFVAIIAPIYFDEHGRGLHDDFAGTVVIDASVRSSDEGAGLDVEELAETS